MLSFLAPWLCPLLSTASPLNWLAWLITSRTGRYVGVALVASSTVLYGAWRLYDTGRQAEIERAAAAAAVATTRAAEEKSAATAADNEQRDRDAAEIAQLKQRIAELERPTTFVTATDLAHAPAPSVPGAAPASGGCTFTPAQRDGLRKLTGPTRHGGGSGAAHAPSAK